MPKAHPRHYYQNDTVYFITARVYKSNNYLDSEIKKKMLVDLFFTTLADYRYRLFAWVVLDNHYHFLFKTRVGDTLPQMMKQLHANSREALARLDTQKRKVAFYNYWDSCLRNRNEFFCYFNYVHLNPVKHGYVQQMSDYAFSSYQYWLDKKGEVWLKSQFEKYPPADLLLGKEDDF